MTDQAVTPETIAKNDNDQRAQQRGRNAQAILDNPVFQEVFAGMRSAIVDAISTINLQDTEGVVLAAQRLKVIDMVEADFRSYVQVGEEATRNLERRQKSLDELQEQLDMERNNLFRRGIRRAQSLMNAKEAASA